MSRMDALLNDLAVSQHGVLNRRQALAVGISRSALRTRLRRGTIELLSPGVYRVAAVPETWRQRVIAACFACGETAVASHLTAAALHAFDGVREGPIEITVPRTASLRPGGVQVHRPREAVADCDRTTVDGIPCTTRERTLVDIARTWGLRRAEDALDGAQRDRHVVPAALFDRAEELRGRGRTGVGRFSDLVELRIGASQPTSHLERRALRLLEMSGMPRPTCQHAVEVDGRRYVLDFAYVQLRVAIEVDGRIGHAGDRGRQSDNERDTRLRLVGWDVYRFTYRDITERPDYFLTQIDRALSNWAANGREN